MAKRTGEETRALLLRIGMRMVLERGVAAGIQHIRLQEVLRAAGLTTGAAYRLWADQTEYQRDLAVELLRFRVSPPAELARTVVEDLPAERSSMDDVMRAAADSHVQSIAGEGRRADTRAFLIALALRASAGEDPVLAAASHRRHEESIAEYSEFYTQLMRAHGIRMRTPLTVVEFAEAMSALGEGFAVRGAQGLPHPHITATDADDVPTGRWSLFALGVRALVHEFMIPIDGDWN